MILAVVIIILVDFPVNGSLIFFFFWFFFNCFFFFFKSLSFFPRTPLPPSSLFSDLSRYSPFDPPCSALYSCQNLFYQHRQRCTLFCELFVPAEKLPSPPHISPSYHTMGNVATKERSRSNSVSYVMYQQQQQQHASTHNRPRTRSVPDPLVGIGSSSRHHRKSKKKREEPQPIIRLTLNLHESVDGGYLQPHGVYSGSHDFEYPVVRKLLLDRRLAPFFKGLQDYKKTWTDAELLEAVKNSSLPSPEPESSGSIATGSSNEAKTKTLTSVPDLNSNNSSGISTGKTTSSQPNYVIPDSEVIGLYRDVIECPICFLFYPNRLNLTRCCEQPICTECFVQIQRQPPHYPEEDDEESGTIEEQSARQQQKQKEKGLISEPACCPFCMAPEMGITYTPPRVRTGLASAKAKLLSLVNESKPSSDFVAVIDDDEDNSGEELAVSSGSTPPSERRGSLAATDPEVITTDQIRPDWALKLAAARAYVARKSATASAIHASAFNPRAVTEQSDSSSSAGNSSGAGASMRPPRSMVVDVNPRLQELEDMMLMEAIRLSILEEERRSSNSTAPADSPSAASRNARPAGRVRNH